MTVSTDEIARDLDTLVRECNQSAAKLKALDPLREISYSLSREPREDGAAFTITIERNSGGSPESDYIIQDEVIISAPRDGSAKVVFRLEMMDCDSMTIDRLTPENWSAARNAVDVFCRKPITSQEIL